MVDDKRAIFVDTSIFSAFLDRDDQDHQTASDLLEEAHLERVTRAEYNGADVEHAEARSLHILARESTLRPDPYEEALDCS